ncbi:MAG: hypothetical protein Q7S48_04930 [bacterium]|nr:hypothetical protein [bacterium]
MSVNLIGMFVRGLVLISEMKKMLSKGSSAFRKVAAEFYKPSEEKRTNIIALILIIVFLGVLYYFWNTGVVIAAVLIMVAHIPDLLWEIKHGGVGGSKEVQADALSRPNAMSGKYMVAQNGYGLAFENFQSKKGGGLLLRLNLADAVIASAEKNGIDTNNRSEASLLGEFVVAKTREGKVPRRKYSNMPAAYMLTNLVILAALPVLWYALYQL